MSIERLNMGQRGQFGGAFEAVETVDLARFKPRSLGVLDTAELAFCRTAGIPVAYDPVQIGWVMAECDDDISTAMKGAAPTAAGLRFRPWQDADAQVLARLLSDPDLWTYLPENYAGPINETTAQALIGLAQDSQRHLVYAVERGTTIAGQVRLEFGAEAAGATVGEISYWLGRSHWGKGLGREIVARFTRLCFERQSDLGMIIAKVHRDNPASARALLGAGYRKTSAHPFGAEWDRYEIRRSHHA